jgi:hypothetical protein
LTRRGHWTSDGFVSEPDIKNLTWSALPGAYVKQYWYCRKNHGQMRMLLKPDDGREPAQFWECNSCGRRISVERRDKTFSEVIDKLKDAYELKALEYNKVSDTWTIESSEWEEDRIRGRVKTIGATLRKEIPNACKLLIEKELEIILESIRDYFIN